MANSRALNNLDDVINVAKRVRRVHSAMTPRTLVAIQDEIARLNRRGALDNDAASALLDAMNHRRRHAKARRKRSRSRG